MRRFTATEKWEKTWFQELPPHLKCLWMLMCDRADAAGVWEANWKLASALIGKSVNASDLSHFEGRAITFGNGKVVIPSFLEFQYGKLSNECRAHIPIFRLIEKHRVFKGYSMAMNSHKEQDKEKEEDKVQETEEPNPIPSPVIDKARGTLEEIKAFCVEIGLPASDGESCFHKWEGKGWKNGGDSIKCWRSTIRSWKTAGYLPSQKNGTGKPAGGIRENILPHIE